MSEATPGLLQHTVVYAAVTKVSLLLGFKLLINISKHSQDNGGLAESFL
jgi:hypothetical protein